MPGMGFVALLLSSLTAAADPEVESARQARAAVERGLAASGARTPPEAIVATLE